MKTAFAAALLIMLAFAPQTFAADKQLDKGTILSIATALKSAQTALKTCTAANNRPPTVEEMRDWKCLLLKTDAEGKTTGYLAEKPINPINNSTIIMSEANPKNVGGWTYKTDGKTCSLRIIIPADYAKETPKLIEAALKEHDFIVAK
jgi:hypothetical protein